MKTIKLVCIIATIWLCGISQAQVRPYRMPPQPRTVQQFYSLQRKIAQNNIKMAIYYRQHPEEYRKYLQRQYAAESDRLHWGDVGKTIVWIKP